MKVVESNCSKDQSLKLDTAVILAGGQSSRMGFDKQFLEIQGKALLEEMVGCLKKEFDEIIVVTNETDSYQNKDYRIVKDEYKDCGPLGGIQVGLKHCHSDYAYFIACDMPNINLNYIRYMKKRIQERPVSSCVSKNQEGQIEPLNGFYAKCITKKIEKKLKANQRAIRYLLKEIDTLYIEAEIVNNYQQEGDMFLNLNTPDDLNKLLKKKNALQGLQTAL